MQPKPAETIAATAEGILRVGASGVTPLTSDLESVRCLLPLGRGEFIAGTATGGLFYSRRFGTEWHAASLALRGNPIVSLHVSRGSRPVVFSGDGAGHVLKSSDLARSFLKLGAPPETLGPVYVSGVAATLPTILLAAANGAWLSENAAESFRPLRLPPGCAPCCPAVAHPVDTEHWLFACRRGLLITTDAGTRFDFVPIKSGNLPVAVQFEPASPHRLYVLTRSENSARSQFWVIEDRGFTLTKALDAELDAARDPTGLITCFTFRIRQLGQQQQCLDLLAGTDRGEIIAVDEGPGGTRVRDGLPPIHSLLSVSSYGPPDPSTSGVYVLP